MKVQVYKVANTESCILEIVEVKSDASTDPLTHHIPPFGVPEIIFYIRQTHQIQNVPFANGAIKGLYNISQKIDFIPNYHFIIIRLKPYGLRQLFNINASELLNSVIDLNSHPITEYFFSLLSAKEVLDIAFLKILINCIDQYALYPISSSTKAFIQIAAETEYKTIKKLTCQNGIGQRTLQRNFKKEVGLSPKEYLRIKRLNAVENKMSQHVSIFEIIADFDYSDQAHFIKDFKKLRDFTPSEVVKNKLLLSDQLTVPEIIRI